MLARHMPRYLPGSPAIVVEARPGAGGVLAANTVYSTEPKDGTVIGTFGETLVLQQVLGASGVQYDAAKFQWIGSAVNTAMACAARTDSGITSMRDVLDGKPFVIGTMAPGSATYDVPAVINAALGLNIKLVTGYDGVSRLILATESKEVDGYCASFISMTTTAPQPFQGDPPMARVVVIMGDKTPDHPWLAGVPAAETLAATDEARQLLRAAQASAQITNPYTVAPEVPRDRVEALRKAFWETFNDPQFLAEAQQVGMTFSPSNGEQVTRVVESLLATPPATLARLKEIIVK
jgi:tripartite-type tricarboxylate transporter receptor subunit TctC